MKKPLLAKHKAKGIYFFLFFIGLAALFFFNTWWPWVMLVVGVPLALKQFLTGRFNDAIMSLFVFVGFFVIAQFNISWQVLIPIFFVMAAIYLLCKEWVRDTVGEDKDKNQ